MIGSPLRILTTFFFVALGTMTIGVAFEGYFLKRLKIWEDILLGASGVCLFIPNLVTKGLAVVFLAVFVVRNLIQARQGKLLSVAGEASGYDPKMRP